VVHQDTDELGRVAGAHELGGVGVPKAVRMERAGDARELTEALEALLDGAAGEAP
jgi:hypothetical protein